MQSFQNIISTKQLGKQGYSATIELNSFQILDQEAALKKDTEEIINNADKNYFVVDAQYNLNPALQAYNRQITQSANLWQSEWDTPFVLCHAVAEALDFEFYCNEDGHLIFRPPKYNRTPVEFFYADDSYLQANLAKYINYETVLTLQDEVKQLDTTIQAQQAVGTVAKDILQSREAKYSSLQQYNRLAFNNIFDIVNENHINRIYDSEIIRYDLTEHEPDFTSIDVFGKPDLVDIAQTADNWYWAGATDFDLWRMYGYKAGGAAHKPFFKDALNQCAPYALSLIQRQWGKIFHCSMLVRGDSRYRIGDTVYVKDLNMMFYIEQVAHSFTYGSSFTTSLTLTYGRRPGQWFVVPFDTIGALMIAGEKDRTAALQGKTNLSPKSGWSFNEKGYYTYTLTDNLFAPGSSVLKNEASVKALVQKIQDDFSYFQEATNDKGQVIDSINDLSNCTIICKGFSGREDYKANKQTLTSLSYENPAGIILKEHLSLWRGRAIADMMKFNITTADISIAYDGLTENEVLSRSRINRNNINMETGRYNPSDFNKVEISIIVGEALSAATMEQEGCYMFSKEVH